MVQSYQRKSCPIQSIGLASGWVVMGIGRTIPNPGFAGSCPALGAFLKFTFHHFLVQTFLFTVHHFLVQHFQIQPLDWCFKFWAEARSAEEKRSDDQRAREELVGSQKGFHLQADARVLRGTTLTSVRLGYVGEDSLAACQSDRTVWAHSTRQTILLSFVKTTTSCFVTSIASGPRGLAFLPNYRHTLTWSYAAY